MGRYIKREWFHLGYVVWRDACAQSKESERALQAGQIVTSSGLIVSNDKTGVTIARDLIDDGRFRDQLFVPRAYIERMAIVRRNVASRSLRTVKVPGHTFEVV